MSSALHPWQYRVIAPALLAVVVVGCSDADTRDEGDSQTLDPTNGVPGAATPGAMDPGHAGSAAPAGQMPTAGASAEPAPSAGADAGAPAETPPGAAVDPVVSDDVVLEPCEFEAPDGTEVRCGYLLVPENRSDLAEGDIPLHFAIFRATAAARVADPVVYLEGGPGASALARAGDLHALLAPAIGDERDLVLVDQRGTGLSVVHSPFSCRDDVTAAALGGGLFGPPIVAGLRACGERLRGAGVDIAAYNSRESATDFEELRVALGYPPWNLLGISYGTFLGQIIMRDHPAGVRSIVLDSTLPVGDDYTRNPINLQRALEALFEACAGDQDCAQWYPGLKGTFYTLLQRLENNPVSANLQLPGSAAPVAVPVPPAIFLNGTFNALYSPALLAVVPRMIVEMAAGDSEIFAQLFNSVIGRQSGVSDGMHYAVTCYDRVAFTTAQDMTAAIDAFPDLSAMYQNFLGSDAPAACAAYGAGRAEPVEAVPVSGGLPTLVIGGHFDPVTAPAGGYDVAAMLDNGHFIEFPWQSHGAIRSPCAQSAIDAFLQDPSAAPDSDCLASEPELTFIAPDGPLPQLYEIQAFIITAPL